MNKRKLCDLIIDKMEWWRQGKWAEHIDTRTKDDVITVMQNVVDSIASHRQTYGRKNFSNRYYMEWFPSDLPPDDDRNVFLCHGTEDFRTACLGHYDAERKMYYEDKNWFATPMYDVLCWCEMPPLPMKEGKYD